MLCTVQIFWKKNQQMQTLTFQSKKLKIMRRNLGKKAVVNFRTFLYVGEGGDCGNFFCDGWNPNVVL